MSDVVLFLSYMLPGSFFLGLYDVISRKILKTGVDESFLLGTTFTISGIMLAVPLFIVGIPEIKDGFWMAFWVTAILNIFAQFFWFRAFKEEEASIISPFRLLIPPLVLLTGWLTLKEVPSLVGSLGVIITAFGLWLLLRSDAASRSIKLSEILKRRGVLFALLGTLSFAITYPFDKKAVITSSSLFFAATVFILMGLVHFAYSSIMRREERRNFFEQFKNIRGSVFIFALVYALGLFFSLQALNYAVAAYASSVKRLSSLWAVLLSGALLQEKNISKKLIAVAVMFGGVIVTLFLS